MIKKTTILAVLYLVSIDASAFAEELLKTNYYIKLNAGPSFPSKVGRDFPGASISHSEVYGVALGYNFNNNFDADIAFDYRPKYINNYTDDVDEEMSSHYQTRIKSWSLMTNIYYNFKDFYNFTPYVTIGAGLARNSTSGSKISTTYEGEVDRSDLYGAPQTNFAYKAGLGVKYKIKNNVDIGLQYQFVNLGRFKTGDTVSLPQGRKVTGGLVHKGFLKSNEILLALSYKF